MKIAAALLALLLAALSPEQLLDRELTVIVAHTHATRCIQIGVVHLWDRVVLVACGLLAHPLQHSLDDLDISPGPCNDLPHLLLHLQAVVGRNTGASIGFELRG